MSKYFQKIAPQTRVLLSNGTYLTFQAVDRRVGIWPPEGQELDSWIEKELLSAIAGERGGITEITKSEYDALVKKKETTPLKPRWREELSKNSLGQFEVGSRIPVATFNAQGSQASAAGGKNISVGPPTTG